MSEVKKCPFCNEGVIYETSREDYLGTVIPQLFCNSCKMIFEVENDSPYLDDAKTHDYLKEKLYKQFNTRKPMDEIVERLEKHIRYCELCHEEFKNESMSLIYEVQINSYKNAIEIVKEVGGMNEKVS